MNLLAALVLSLTLAGCTSAQTSAGSEKPPEEIFGKWYIGGTSSLAFLDRRTGIADAAGGNSFSLELKLDGQFVKAGVMKTGLYGCSVIVFNYQTGRYKAEGSQLILVGTENFLSYKDSCNASMNSEKNKPPITSVYEYQLSKDEQSGEAQLCLSKDNGQDCYRPAKTEN